MNDEQQNIDNLLKPGVVREAVWPTGRDVFTFYRMHETKFFVFDMKCLIDWKISIFVLNDNSFNVHFN